MRLPNVKSIQPRWIFRDLSVVDSFFCFSKTRLQGQFRTGECVFLELHFAVWSPLFDETIFNGLLTPAQLCCKYKTGFSSHCAHRWIIDKFQTTLSYPLARGNIQLRHAWWVCVFDQWSIFLHQNAYTEWVIHRLACSRNFEFENDEILQIWIWKLNS